MTEKTIPVDVEWALEGKTLGRAGARVLASSNGNLSRENFTEVIGRFSPGTPDQLPQVSVSFVTSGDGADRTYYLGLALHKWAADVQTDGGELLERDDDGRPVAVTIYFCVPYKPLAKAAVPYQAMYTELDNIRLGTISGPPLQVEFPVRSGVSSIDALAMQSAGRLLTGRPVCVLGAESATMAERLEFIGTVAALLPYGFRTRLAAATWVRPTHRDHRFRLFFSATKRDAQPPDDVIYWGHPGQTALTPSDDYAYRYDRWLTDTVGQLEEALAQLTTPRSFNSEEVIESLGEIGVSLRGQDKAEEPRSRPAASSLASSVASRLTSRSAKLDIDQLLRDCASYMQNQQLADLNTVSTRMKARAKSGISHEERGRCQKFIQEQHLFRHNGALGKFESTLREALLKVAFAPPLTYWDYCLIEDSYGAGSPDMALIRLIDNMGMLVTDMRIRTVVYAQMQEKEIRKKLDSWYISAQVTAPQMINLVIGEWRRPSHAFYAGMIAADLMRRIKCDPPLIRKMLQNHSYLAHLLQAGGGGLDYAQVNALTAFLGTAYPNGLCDVDIQQVLIHSAEPPSRALLAAVLLNIAHPEDAPVAREAYVYRTTLAMNLYPEMREDLKSRLALGLPDGLAAKWESRPQAGQA